MRFYFCKERREPWPGADSSSSGSDPAHGSWETKGTSGSWSSGIFCSHRARLAREPRPGQAPSNMQRPRETIWPGRSESFPSNTAGVGCRSAWESRKKEQGCETRSPGNWEINKGLLGRGGSLWSWDGTGMDWLWEEWPSHCDILTPLQADTVRALEPHSWKGKGPRSEATSLPPTLSALPWMPAIFSHFLWPATPNP